ncbi:hypothetical protein N7539_004283 [Penicillium diatomitis]|uniref:Uncharacterized protein n=1 Tax=Penicillium diatomitis TaxID=2819901 RepID=A0A9W9XE61_9EURO|nr:uncharacterized protein N7539_004283 [Penicillium diatomitis]KAJ5489393.1 hypothetical protein N7539_004283 [Penicillium diatomitis]
MDEEEAPPPYSADDPLTSTDHSRNGDSQDGQPVRGSMSSTNSATSSHASRSTTAAWSAIGPTHFTSAAAYFVERRPTTVDNSRDLLHHSMTIYPRSSIKDFPRRPRCWSARVEEVAQQDWDMFLRHLFPPQLGPAAASQHLPRQLRAEIQRDRKDRPQETDEQRQARIAAVVDEWNQCFFEPRATRISFVYIGESETAPSSALCPRCYPAATRANHQPGSDGQQTPSSHHGPLAAGYPAHPFNGWSTPINQIQFPYPQQAPYGSYGMIPAFPFSGGPPPNHLSPQYIPPNLYPPGMQQWQWNNWPYNQQQYAAQRPEKSSGTFGWISSLTSQAQKYGERFAEQAQHYGDQISTQAMHYGRRVEDQALAHGRWIEEQARLHGRKQGAYPPAPYAIQQPYPSSGQISGAPQNTASTSSGVESPSQPITENPDAQAGTPNSQEEIAGRDHSQVNDGTRPEKTDDIVQVLHRTSFDSISSESSLDSIDSISTTSDLTPADLAAVRLQLQDLNNGNDRTKYDAALDLRQQLYTLQESRREAKVSVVQNWRRRLGHFPGNGTDSSDWGCWDSPEQQARQVAERRAMKDEVRHTQQAFRDLVLHARNEKRNRRLARQNRQRQTSSNAGPAVEHTKPLEGCMASLSLGSSQSATTAYANSRAVSSSMSSRSVSTLPSEVTEPSVGSVSETAPSKSIDNNDIRKEDTQREEKKSRTHGRLKEILRPLGSKKQPQDKHSKKAKEPNRDGDTT